MAGSIVGEAWVAVGAQTDKVDEQIVGAFTAGGKKGAEALDKELVEGAKKTGKSTGQSLVEGLAAAFAAKKIFDFGKEAFMAADESRKIASQTEAVIKSTGMAAGITAKQIDDLASSISKKNVVDDEAIQKGANLLLTFTNIRNEAGDGNDIFNRTTEIMTDMAAAMGTDVSAGAIQLGKALNDPVNGITALTRVGVTFTDEQKKMIQVLAETGDVAGAQRVILDELTKEFGGSAAAQATASDRMRLAWGNLQETIGEQLIPVVDKALSGVTKMTESFEALPKPIQSVALGFGGMTAGLFALSKMLEVVRNTNQNLIPLFKRIVDSVSEVGPTGERSFGRLGKALGAATGVAAVAGMALFAKSIYDASNTVKFSVEDMAGATQESLDKMAVQFKIGIDAAQGWNSANKLNTQSQEEFRNVAENNVSTAQRLIEAFDKAGINTDVYRKILDEAIESTHRRNIEEEKSQEILKETAPVLETMEERVAAYSKMMGENDKAVDAVRVTHEELQKALKDADKAVSDLMDSIFGITNADADWNAALEEAAATIKENGPILDVWTQKGRENRDVLAETVENAGKWLGKIYEQEGASENFKRTSSAIRTALIDTLKQAGLSEQGIAEYVAVFDKIPGVIETEVRTNFTVFKGPGWDQYFQQLNNFGASFGAKGGTFQPIDYKLPPIPSYAMGGVHQVPGGMAIVGELGPELVQFGRTSAVFPSDKFEAQMVRALRAALGNNGSGTTVNVIVDNVSYGDATQVGDMVGQSVRRVLMTGDIGIGVRQGAGR
jgi:hypothetical protein